MPTQNQPADDVATAPSKLVPTARGVGGVGGGGGLGWIGGSGG